MSKVLFNCSSTWRDWHHCASVMACGSIYEKYQTEHSNPETWTHTGYPFVCPQSNRPVFIKTVSIHIPKYNEKHRADLWHGSFPNRFWNMGASMKQVDTECTEFCSRILKALDSLDDYDLKIKYSASHRVADANTTNLMVRHRNFIGEAWEHLWYIYRTVISVRLYIRVSISEFLIPIILLFLAHS